METTPYQLKSLPGRTVEVPKEYDSKARTLIELVKEGDPQKLLDSNQEYPCLTNPGIFSRAVGLLKNSNSVMIEDALYLRVCLNYIERDLVEDVAPEDSRKMICALDKFIEEVESPR